MQHMNPQERSEYEGYKGKSSYSDDEGQKIGVTDDDDELYATLLARKIKQELRDELSPGKDATIGYRLALAIVSICILVPIFITFVIALSVGLGAGGNGIALAYGTVAICVAIVAVNGYFNWSCIKNR
jgi:hypothetical protein